jgi:hypothetical protein
VKRRSKTVVTPSLEEIVRLTLEAVDVDPVLEPLAVQYVKGKLELRDVMRRPR